MCEDMRRLTLALLYNSPRSGERGTSRQFVKRELFRIKIILSTLDSLIFILYQKYEHQSSSSYYSTMPPETDLPVFISRNFVYIRLDDGPNT